MADKKITLTEKAAACLAVLKVQEEPMLGAQLAEATGFNPKGIHGVVNSLVNKGLVGKVKKEAQVVNAKGDKVTQDYTAYFVTDAGEEFEVEAKETVEA